MDSTNLPRSFEHEIILSTTLTRQPRGSTPIRYLYGYVLRNGVVILKLLILNGVSISEAFSRMGYKKLWITALSSP